MLALRKAKLGFNHPDTLRGMMNLACSYGALGRHAEALKLHEKTLELQKAKLGPAHPDTLMSMNNLAESLATASDAKLRDPMRALRFAQAVVQHTPKNGGYWNTLGVVCYRAGDWSQAIAALEKSEALNPGQNVAHNCFFLAMAHWQRGNQADARKWYERAAEWMEKNNPKDAELRRFREEASKKTALARFSCGRISCQHNKPHRSRIRMGLELLEDRTLLSTAIISGLSTATDTAFHNDTPPYTLRMIASDPASQWTINWGDGSVQTITGNATRATHAHTTGQVVRNISATAVINGQTVVATTSGAGAAVGAFCTILPGEHGMVFGPDITGDQYGDLYVLEWDNQAETGSLQVYDGKTGAFIRTLSPQSGTSMTSITLGPDNDLYYTSAPAKCVFRYDFATASTTTFVAPGSGGLDGAFGLAFGHDANNDGVPDL